MEILAVNAKVSGYWVHQRVCNLQTIKSTEKVSRPLVIFPIKMPPVHEVLSWSLGWQGIILTGVLTFRRPNCVVGTTFAKHLSLWNAIFPVKMTPCPQSLELESMRTGGHPDRSWNVLDTQLKGINIFWQAFISPKCHLRHQDAPCPQCQELESMRTGGHPEGVGMSRTFF